MSDRPYNPRTMARPSTLVLVLVVLASGCAGLVARSSDDLAPPGDPLTLYRVLAPGDQPLGNVLRLAKTAGGVSLIY